METSAENLAALGAELKSARRQLAQAHRELQARVAQLVMLYRIGRDLSNHSNWDEALGRLLASLRDFLKADGAALLLRSEGDGTVRARRVDGLDEATIERACTILQNSQAVTAAEPYLLPLEAVESIDPLPCVDQKKPWKETVVPLRHRERDLGYLILQKPYANGEAIAQDIYFLITVQTILTEEVAAAQAVTELRKLQRFQERTLDEVASGILTFDEAGRRLYANRKGRELLGESDAVDRVTVRMGGEVVDLLSWAQQAQPGQPVVGEGWVQVGDGEATPVSIRATRMAAEIPGQTNLVLILDDQRATRALEVERRRVARQQENLIMAAEWAHDVRTPLTGILHSAELLSEALPPRSNKRRHFDVVRREVERIDGLVSNFLDFARPVQLKLSAVDLPALCASVVELMQAAAGEKDCRLRVERSAERAEVWADANQLKQILLNLVSNAVDASPRGGEIVVRVSEDAAPAEIAAQRPVRRVAVLEVEDEGEGVAPDQIERLFVPFFTTKSEGTGLGLAIAEKIIRAHHGHLRYLRRNGRTVLRAVIPLTAAAGDGSSPLQARG